MSEIATWINIVHTIQPDATPDDIADALWLAWQMHQASQAVHDDLTIPHEGIFHHILMLQDTAQPPKQPKPQSPTETAFIEPPGTLLIPTGQQSGIATQSGGLSFRSPAAPALPGTLPLARSLRPFMRRIPSRTNVVFDEAATVRCIAEQRIWTALFRPAPERWFAVDLVVDESAAMVVWQPTIAELRRLLESHGAFRYVRVWRLKTDAKDEHLVLYPANGQHPCHPNSLHNSMQQTMILVISDCVSSGWRQGKVTKLLHDWSTHSPLAIVQLLPQRLWDSSALGQYLSARFSVPTPGCPNTFFTPHIVNLLDIFDEEQDHHGLNVPVLTIEPESLARWAQVITGTDKAWVPGYIIQPKHSDKDIQPALQSKPSLTPEARVQRFQTIASPTAQKLAGYLAAAPLTLPVMRLVQRTMVPESRQIHLAEVFLGGLLKQVSPADERDPNRIQYDFVDNDVRELFLDTILVPESIEVLRSITSFVEQHLGHMIDFEAILEDPECVDNVEINDHNRPFANVAARVLRRLGGRYAKVAERLIAQSDPPQSDPPQSDPSQSDPPQSDPPQSDPAFQEFPITIDEWYHEYVQRNTVFGSPAGYWCYVRPGTYHIGGWKEGEESADIELPGFWIAKHPVTVAQYKLFINNDGYTNKAWWTENGWAWKEDEEREQPWGWNEKRFHIANQPVVGLTWYEATAFANWLTSRLNDLLTTQQKGSQTNQLTIRLPTEAEWEVAAVYDAAMQRHRYPWGEEEPTPKHAILSDKNGKRNHPEPVGERPLGKAACGAHDMVGNVWELTTSSYKDYPKRSHQIVKDFIIREWDVPWRGGAYYSDITYCHCAARYWDHPVVDILNYSGVRLLLPL